MSPEAAKGGENNFSFLFFLSMYKAPASRLADDIVERSRASCRILTDSDFGRRRSQFVRSMPSVNSM